MKLNTITLFGMLFSPMIQAADISGPPPVGLLLFQYEKVREGTPNTGAHGLKEYCYKTESGYVVYSSNRLGEGYSFASENPVGKRCVVSSGKINERNLMGLSIGSTIEDSSKLLGVELQEGKNTIVWHYQRAIRNQPYDDMTTLNITIRNRSIYVLDLFNTVTN